MPAATGDVARSIPTLLMLPVAVVGLHIAFGPGRHLAWGWKVYYAVVFWSDAMQVISLLALVVAAYAALRRSLRRTPDDELRVQEPVAVIVPCYLPNEALIIEGTIRHLLTELAHMETLHIYLAYNTPHDLPEAEAALQALAAEVAGSVAVPKPTGGAGIARRLVVQRVHGSRSKAENLNHVIPQLSEEFVAIYDADHWPDRESLAMGIRQMKRSGSDCVQGSTYIRQGCIIPRIMVSAEFFMNYFVVLPAMQEVAGTGFFGGANGIWRTVSLQQLQFDDQALTEDIDCFARAIVSHGFRFEFLPECCSGELLPSGLKAFWRQRLRWAMGWDQVTLKHASSFVGGGTSSTRKAGLCYIFFCRWLSQVCALFIVVLNARSAIQWKLAEPGDELRALHVPDSVYRLQVASFYGYCSYVGYAWLRAVLHRPCTLLPGLFLYFLFLPAYILLNSVLLAVSLLRVTTGCTGGWVVTSRAHGLSVRVCAEDKADAGQDEPLLGSRQTLSSAALSVLVVAFAAQGAVAGAVVGDVVGQHKVVAPFLYVTDGRMVALCMAAGVAIAMVVLAVALWAMKACRHTRARRAYLRACR